MMRRQERSRSPSPRRSGNVGSARNDGGYVGDRGGSGGGYFRDDRGGGGGGGGGYVGRNRDWDERGGRDYEREDRGDYRDRGQASHDARSGERGGRGDDRPRGGFDDRGPQSRRDRFDDRGPARVGGNFDRPPQHVGGPPGQPYVQRPPPGRFWDCPACGKQVYENKNECYSCRAPKPYNVQYVESNRTFQQQTLQRDGDWRCPSCGANCYASKTECFKCGTKAPLGMGGRKPGPPSFTPMAPTPSAMAAFPGLNPEDLALLQSMQGGGGNDLKKQTEYKVVDGKFRKVIDGVIDYDWQGF